MRKDLSDITLVVDRSGSMEACRKEAQGGIDSFIREQKESVGDALFSLFQFDTESKEYVFNAVPIKSVQSDYKLVPRGGTPLLDALGKVIAETGNRLSNIPEDQRPGLVIVCVVTDGEENSSTEFTKDKIKEMIQHQQDVYNWQFTFLGANQDAFAEAGSIGIAATAVSAYHVASAGAAYKGMSQNVSRMRSASIGGQNIMNAYTDEEREEMNK